MNTPDERLAAAKADLEQASAEPLAVTLRRAAVEAIEARIARREDVVRTHAAALVSEARRVKGVAKTLDTSQAQARDGLAAAVEQLLGAWDAVMVHNRQVAESAGELRSVGLIHRYEDVDGEVDLGTGGSLDGVLIDGKWWGGLDPIGALQWVLSVALEARLGYQEGLRRRYGLDSFEATAGGALPPRREPFVAPVDEELAAQKAAQFSMVQGAENLTPPDRRQEILAQRKQEKESEQRRLFMDYARTRAEHVKAIGEDETRRIERDIFPPDGHALGQSPEWWASGGGLGKMPAAKPRNGAVNL